MSARYSSHDGPHEWSLPVAELGGKRACRKCGHIAAGREDFFAVQKAKRTKAVAA
jgi:hypothetical protein